MENIHPKTFQTHAGKIEYYYQKNPNNDLTILFIHGLTGNKEWFPDQYQRFDLQRYSWITYDLLGHGKSDKPPHQEYYTMEFQASILRQLLETLDVKQMIIFAHSMGGPIAISLLENILNPSTQFKIDCEVLGLFYLEGNLDRGNATFSGIVADYSQEAFEENFESFIQDIAPPSDPDSIETLEAFRTIGAFALWATCVDLARTSRREDLLPRLLKIASFPIYFIFGENNKGTYSSELLLQNNNQPLIYIPKAGHGLYLENPRDFWKQTLSLLESKMM
ncbi:2-succinyl-6-hydroxy-2,4-cyclohexadiene-1-carboxylate synthase [Candidatus Lokiarchaeum ossiferum]|uniref:2-succinyl-6-hydroxy-2, 4-cyclohexadiene-1-carboxylate synthase n=1 Tax=Candidatus Lokiarchaeum ossiferum TaxID=2951803 RepID=A0ABY6HNG3_9ARCH|nr:2-succinyl-6-hydroxy-2,4-cyclohexadiene-1-carboxylate synthase [Candidatus Lokiarchaeum sp. B-35]